MQPYKKTTRRNTTFTYSRSFTDDRKHKDKIDCVKLPDAENEAGLSLGHLLFKTSFVIGWESLGDTGGSRTSRQWYLMFSRKGPNSRGKYLLMLWASSWQFQRRLVREVSTAGKHSDLPIGYFHYISSKRIVLCNNWILECIVWCNAE